MDRSTPPLMAKSYSPSLNPCTAVFTAAREAAQAASVV